MLGTKSLSRLAIAASLSLVGAGGVLLVGSEPAAALCKGTGAGKCIQLQRFGTKIKDDAVRIPDSNWVDPDCKHYGNCNSPNSARQGKGGTKLQPGTTTTRSANR